MGTPSLTNPLPPTLLGATPTSSSTVGTKPSICNWKDFLRGRSNPESDSNLYFVESEGDEVVFSDDDISESQKEWELFLVGYAVGKRPFYGTLLNAVNRKWKLLGTFELLTMSEGFFRFKFSCKEDFNMVFDSGPCFLSVRPFIFCKWTWDFQPVKEDFSEIP